MRQSRDRSHERLVRVAVAENPATAGFIQDVLKGAGIRCLAKNVDPGSAITGGLPFSVEIFVLEGDAAAAEALLSDERAAPPEQLPAPTQRPRRRHLLRRPAKD